MKIRSTRGILAVGAVLLMVALGLVVSLSPFWAAYSLLHPPRHRPDGSLPANSEKAVFTGAGVTLKGWRCRALGKRRGTLVYLHGVSDNCLSGAGLADRYVRRGFDVVAYDSRGHGDSTGDACTCGFFERQDLRCVLDTIESRGLVLFGASLGGAVALLEAADDPRVTAVVAVETFSDLRTVVLDRAPFFLTQSSARKALALAEQRGGFRVDDVSPAAAAARIRVPVLLIHGSLDRDTRIEHSQRVFAALSGPKHLIAVPGAHHNESLSGNVWTDIDNWIDRVVPQ